MDSKRILLFFSFVLFVILASYRIYTYSFSSKSLIAEYTLDEAGGDISDISSNGYTLKIHGSPHFQQEGVLNSAVEFATGSAFSCDPTQCPKTSATLSLSIGAWVKAEKDRLSGRQQYIISKWGQSPEAFSSSSSYSLFDPTVINASSKGFAGAIYDGRYVYFVPIRNSNLYYGIVSRYDTSEPFTSSKSWSFFDVSKLNPRSIGFGGGIFDGRFIYFVPNYNQDSRSGLVTRYDISKGFNSPESWSFFDMSEINSQAKGFWGGVFDGRFIYFVPHDNGNGYYGIITRFDTQGNFSDNSSWTFFDMTKIHPNLKGFLGGVFDGKHVYFIPNRINNTVFTGYILRYNIASPFTSFSSWEYFNIASLNSEAVGFAGGVFDGRFIYFVPLFSNTTNFGGVVTRFDTQQKLDSPSAWSFIDLSNLNPRGRGYIGGIFDGRFIYFVPFRDKYEESDEMKGVTAWCPQNETGGFSGNIARYDTSSVFNETSSWKFYDATSLNSEAKGFWGGVFDGRFIYFVPVKLACSIFTGKIVRLDTLGESHGSYRLLYSATNQSGSFSAAPTGLRFDINTNHGIFTVTSNKEYDPQAWLHVFGTFDGRSLKLYVNSELVSENASFPVQTSILRTDDPFTIGSTLSEPNSYFNGTIDNVKIYNYALSQQEIENLYQRERIR